VSYEGKYVLLSLKLKMRQRKSIASRKMRPAKYRIIYLPAAEICSEVRWRRNRAFRLPKSNLYEADNGACVLRMRTKSAELLTVVTLRMAAYFLDVSTVVVNKFETGYSLSISEQVVYGGAVSTFLGN
jgi:hypothetical protein